MHYAIFCYHDEGEVLAWTGEEATAVLAKRAVVTDRLVASGKLPAMAALTPTTTAVTVRPNGDKEPLLIDGPFAETKEALLGFYVVECDSLEEAVAAAREIGKGETGSLEVRPIHIFSAAGPRPSQSI